MRRKALGRGLRSLIPEPPSRAGKAKSDRSAEGLREVDLDLIQPNRRQPRERIDDEALAGLAQSLQNQGILQPVVVRSAPDGRYELVAGERRWRAAQMVGLMKIPALVKEVPDERLLEYALVENLQREELNPIEEATAYRSLADDFGLTQQEIAQRAGKQRTTISNMLRLLALPKAVQEKLKSGQLSTGHAKALLSLKRPGKQAELAERVFREDLPVRQLERICSRAAAEPTGPAAPSKPARDPNVVAAEAELQKELGTKVRIVQDKKGAGRIELHCFSDEELDRVYQVVLKAARLEREGARNDPR